MNFDLNFSEILGSNFCFQVLIVFFALQLVHELMIDIVGIIAFIMFLLLLEFHRSPIIIRCLVYDDGTGVTNLMDFAQPRNDGIGVTTF
jgi:hypothetical protein